MMGGFEAVGSEIWPAKTRKAAGALLSDVLNLDRNNKFSLEEHAMFLRIARDRGVHMPMHFLCDEVGYNRPQPIDQADQEANVALEMEAAARRFESAVSRYERIKGVSELRKLSTVAS